MKNGSREKIVSVTGDGWVQSEIGRGAFKDERLGKRFRQLLAAMGESIATGCERQNAKLLQLRASTSLARLWRHQGKRAEAHDLLAPIYGWFTEGFDAPVLKEVKALLDELT